MKYFLTLLLVAFGLAACKNAEEKQHPSKLLLKTRDGSPVIYLSFTPTKIELLKTNDPKLDYRTEPEYRAYYSNGRYPDGVYTKGQDDIDITLKEGQIIVYNRFYEMIKRLTFKDSLIILDESFDKDKLSLLKSYNYTDSIFVTTGFFNNYGKRVRIEKPHYEIEKYDIGANANITLHSIRKGCIEIIDSWDEYGHFEHRYRHTYLDVDSPTKINSEEIDRTNKFIRKIQ